MVKRKTSCGSIYIEIGYIQLLYLCIIQLLYLCIVIIVSEIRIERLASVFKLCWDVFKLALLNYAVDKAFEVLGYILTYLIKFLQDSKFFTVLRQIGGWVIYIEDSLHIQLLTCKGCGTSDRIKSWET